MALFLPHGLVQPGLAWNLVGSRMIPLPPLYLAFYLFVVRPTGRYPEETQGVMVLAQESKTCQLVDECA